MERNEIKILYKIARQKMNNKFIKEKQNFIKQAWPNFFEGLSKGFAAGRFLKGENIKNLQQDTLKNLLKILEDRRVNVKKVKTTKPGGLNLEELIEYLKNQKVNEETIKMMTSPTFRLGMYMAEHPWKSALIGAGTIGAGVGGKMLYRYYFPSIPEYYSDDYYSSSSSGNQYNKALTQLAQEYERRRLSGVPVHREYNAPTVKYQVTPNSGGTSIWPLLAFLAAVMGGYYLMGRNNNK